MLIDLKALLLKYKLVLRFIVTFLSVYIVLSLIYNWYLDASNGSKYYPDYVTSLVANQTEALLNSFGYNIDMVNHNEEPSIKIVLNDKYVARVIEGCNAFSVIILFVSFIIAFSDGFKKTALYILAGSIIIYALNLLRIALFAMALYHYPKYQDVLHTVIFPLFIYGIMFLLWMNWVNHFTKRLKSNV